MLYGLSDDQAEFQILDRRGFAQRPAHIVRGNATRGRVEQAFAEQKRRLGLNGDASAELQDDGSLEIGLSFDNGDDATLTARRA